MEYKIYVNWTSCSHTPSAYGCNLAIPNTPWHPEWFWWHSLFFAWAVIGTLIFLFFSFYKRSVSFVNNGAGKFFEEKKSEKIWNLKPQWANFRVFFRNFREKEPLTGLARHCWLIVDNSQYLPPQCRTYNCHGKFACTSWKAKGLNICFPLLRGYTIDVSSICRRYIPSNNASL